MKKNIDVAVAVIAYKNQFLLGFRNKNQHQGNRYEFVGGKIEENEQPIQALIREVQEEIGIDISHNQAQKMGIIRHDYGDKCVALHIFFIAFNQRQFADTQTGIGAENQAITWATKSDLLAKHYLLPDANARILDWLLLPDTIFISQSLENLENQQNWLDFYNKHLPSNAFFYHRPNIDSELSIDLLTHLTAKRPDITPLINLNALQNVDYQANNYVVHLNNQQLMTIDLLTLPKDVKYFASCHDETSLSKINELASTHTVIGCFLSPVNDTPTHPEKNGMGWQTFAKLTSLCDVPVFALGGVGISDLPLAWEHGAYGVAGIRLLK